MPTLGRALPSSGYRPRSPTNDLKDIVDDSLEELLGVWDERFRPTYGPLHPRVKDLLEKFVRCGDLHFGFLRYHLEILALRSTRGVSQRLSRASANVQCLRRAKACPFNLTKNAGNPLTQAWKL